MGDPKYPRRMWKKPKRPLNYDLKMEELKTLGTFGLKTKRELWKAHTQLSKVRHQARSLLALGKEIREKKEPILINSLTRIGLISENSTLDDVLNLQVTDLLSRRLQTVVQKKLSFKTPYQARQAVVHGHVMIGDRIINIPSYTVKINEEKEIRLTSDSSLKDLLAQKEEPEIDVKTSEQPEIESTTEPKVESTTEPKVESTTEPKVESTTEPKVESTTEPKVESTTEPKVEKTSTELSHD